LLGMTYLIYNIIQKTEHLRIGVYVFIGSGVVVALINLYQIYANPEILAFNYLKQGVRIIRSTGAENDPNVFASNFFTPILICVAWMGTTTKKWFRLVLFGLAGVMLASVLLSYSRSAWISLFVGIVTIQLFQRKNPILLYGIIALFVVLLISPTVQNLVVSLWDRIVGLFVGGGDDSTKFRVVLAMGALTMIADSYMLGVGFQGFSTYFQYLYPPQQTQWIFEPHNDFYMVFAELGLLGFLLFIVIMYLIFRQALESMRWFRDVQEHGWMQAIGLGFLASFVSYMVFAQFISGLMLNSIFMILVALIFSLSKFTNQTRIQNL
jgi:putative inorganic carbon (HCO3(-)) transporter